MGAQFTIPLITVIPGQLIASSLWNNEFNNINTNFIPAGMDSYSDTDAQMQIQTNPYPGSVTSHATSLGGEIERIRYQVNLMIGAVTPPYWYAAPPTNLTALSNISIPIGGVFDFPSATPPNANYLLANGQAIGRVAFSALFTLIGTAFGAGDGSTTFNIPNYTDIMSIGAGNLYSLAAAGGAVSNNPAISLTDPGHTHSQNAHTHTMGNHTHSTPNHTHVLAPTGVANRSSGTQAIQAASSGGTLIVDPGSTSGSAQQQTATTTSGGAGTSGGPSTNTSDATTATENVSTTGITAGITTVPTLPPYLGMYKLIRVL